MPDAADDFNRADAASLGANWTQFTNGAKITTNQYNVGTANGTARRVTTAATDVQFSQATVTGLPSGVAANLGPAIMMPALGANITASGAFYLLVITGTTHNSISIRRKDDLSSTLTLLGAAVTQTIAVNDILRLESNAAAELVGYVNGIEIARRAQSLQAIAAGQRGVGIYSGTQAANFMDDWTGGDLAGPAPARPQVHPSTAVIRAATR